MSERNSGCACGSSTTYRECCGPLHQGVRAASAEALMRSRYAAFALKNVDYLYRTIHPDHDDASRVREDVLREMKSSMSGVHYMGLRVVASRTTEEGGQVLFVARVFHKGRDISFVELSDFATVQGEWRYVSGVARPVRALRDDLGTLTIEAFLSQC